MAVKKAPAAKAKFTPDLLHATTEIEVVTIRKRDGKTDKVKMSYGEWKVLKKKPTFSYIAYQVGISQFELS